MWRGSLRDGDISFHIIFPSISIGLAAWLTILEALHLATGRTVYCVAFDFWLKIFGVARIAAATAEGRARPSEDSFRYRRRFNASKIVEIIGVILLASRIRSLRYSAARARRRF